MEDNSEKLAARIKEKEEILRKLKTVKLLRSKVRLPNMSIILVLSATIFLF